MRESKKFSLSGFLSAFSFGIVLLLLVLYISGKIFDINYLNTIFESSKENGLIWILLIFVVLANYDKIRGLLESAVNEKIESYATALFIERMKDKLLEDKNFLKE